MTEEKACISVMEVSDHKILPLKNVPECWVEPYEIAKMVKYGQFYTV